MLRGQKLERDLICGTVAARTRSHNKGIIHMSEMVISLVNSIQYSIGLVHSTRPFSNYVFYDMTRGVVHVISC